MTLLQTKHRRKPEVSEIDFLIQKTNNQLENEKNISIKNQLYFENLHLLFFVQ